MGSVWAQVGEASLEYEAAAMTSSAAPPKVSDLVWEEMSPGMRELSKELNKWFSRVPAWDHGHPWRTLPGPRREWTAHTMPCGSQQREERSTLVKELEEEGQRVTLRPRRRHDPRWIRVLSRIGTGHGESKSDVNVEL